MATSNCRIEYNSFARYFFQRLGDSSCISQNRLLKVLIKNLRDNRPWRRDISMWPTNICSIHAWKHGKSRRFVNGSTTFPNFYKGLGNVDAMCWPPYDRASFSRPFVDVWKLADPKRSANTTCNFLRVSSVHWVMRFSDISDRFTIVKSYDIMGCISILKYQELTLLKGRGERQVSSHKLGL